MKFSLKGLRGCWRWPVRLLLWLMMASPGPLVAESASLLIVVGAAGEPEYAAAFARQVEQWQTIGDHGNHRVVVIGQEPPAGFSHRDRIKAVMALGEQEQEAWFWIVLIGHGTFDGREAKFNLHGPDLSATDLASWLESYQRPVVVIDGSSSSAPFLNQLSHTNRIVLTATRSGFEQSYARWGEFLAAALLDAEADLDKDEQVSLLEATVVAGKRVEEFYRGEGRLVSEHALVDDNGDGMGTPVAWFRGVRSTKRPQNKALPDGPRAHQVHLMPNAAEQAMSAEVRAKRDALELELVRLRERSDAMDEEDYYEALEAVLLKLARLYQGAELGTPPSNSE